MKTIKSYLKTDSHTIFAKIAFITMLVICAFVETALISVSIYAIIDGAVAIACPVIIALAIAYALLAKFAYNRIIEAIEEENEEI